MKHFIREFCRSEDGAVTVDWVVLTAVLVGLAGAAGISVREGTDTLSSSVSTELTTIQVDAGDL